MAPKVFRDARRWGWKMAVLNALIHLRAWAQKKVA